MKEIRFNDNTQDINPRDITSLIQCMSNESRFDKQNVFISFREEIQDPKYPMMTTVLFNIHCNRKNPKTKEREYKHFVFQNNRAKTFCCQGMHFHEVESFDSFEFVNH